MSSTRRKESSLRQKPVSVRPSSAAERQSWEAVLGPGEGLSAFLRAAAAAEVRRREAERERQAADPLHVLNELLERARSRT